MDATEQGATKSADVVVEVTDCPECGTEWEVVVTQRSTSSKPSNGREG